jgi:2,3-dihydroxybiphenyl 1,2-dioxygenase
MKTAELAYLGIEVRDPVAMNNFLADVVGLIPGDAIDGAATWRNDERCHRIIVHEGSSDDAGYFGLEFDQDALGHAIERLSRAGFAVTEGSESACAVRRVSRLYRAKTPFGPNVELVTGLATAGPFESPLVAGGFRTSGVGFGHIVFQLSTMQALETAHYFVTEGLGFQQSDWFESDLGTARFYHCNPRHHTLALAFAPMEVPRTLEHVMLEATNYDEVGKAFDRAFTAGAEISMGLGRHDNDRMFSFYAVTPAGFRMEFGAGAREIIEPWAENRRYDRPSVWGHLPVVPPQQRLAASAAAESSQHADHPSA